MNNNDVYIFIPHTARERMTFRFLYSTFLPSIHKYCLNYFSIIAEKQEMCSYYHLRFVLYHIMLFQYSLPEKKGSQVVSL